MRAPAGQLAAVGLFLLGGLFFVILNVLAKALTPELGPVMVIWGRFLFHVVLTALIFPAALVALGRTAHPRVQLGRSVLLMLSTIFNFLALWYLPLADVSAIVFTAPLLVAALSVVVLKERVTALRWAAIVVGLLGALVIIQPTGGGLGVGALLAGGCALAYALYQVSTRLVREAEPIVSLLYAGLTGAVLFTVLLPLGWQDPSAVQWLLLVILGSCGAVGHLMVILALQRLEASRLAPFTYMQLVWAILASLFVFGDVPGLATLGGATVIVGSGLFVWWLNQREASAARPVVAAGPGNP
jgi:drug/metabolite transporter (DMT)-like permease